MFLVAFTFVSVSLLVVWALILQVMEYTKGMMVCFKDGDILGTVCGFLGALLFAGSALIFATLAIHFFNLAICSRTRLRAFSLACCACSRRSAWCSRAASSVPVMAFSFKLVISDVREEAKDRRTEATDYNRS